MTIRLLAAACLVAAASACTTTAGSSADNAPQATSPVPPLRANAALAASIAGDWRDSKNVARDAYRHPAETLTFFGVKPTDTVIEISPSGGWYAEILAPYLGADGRYVAATSAAAADSGGGRRNAALQAKFAADPARYGKVQWLEYDGKLPVLGAAGSADAVLTFRNVHNWVAAETADAYFKAFFDVLKPGGTLGVVDHRAKPGTDLDAMKKSGYLTGDLVVELAQRAGFQLVASSEVNANPKDDTNHPNGVWTLPPTNRHDAADDAKYQAIGESDRMTLRFRKPT
ncbi:class I SAM-dependent methyltransferase [Thermomonas sp. HDW16]|uniref:class I SAM-dependent methyltransferase n=1 Tax=Thermomonas sp. HDW16 TaxID=2714945 RepID=UPI001409E6DE|nr:class I SAM-dependent methyltransferase [Thermomonas sp. HDW16]QIL19483.1 class I SAM-dependent methyltransferase [Thermomonas sp. HDW16]